MKTNYTLIAAAVTAAIAGTGAAQAAVPDLTGAASPTISLNIAGASAPAAAVKTAIERDLCGGISNTLELASSFGTTNFLAYSCQPSSTSANSSLGALVNGTNIFTVYYRTEGGSVIGALPVATAHTVKRLYIPNCNAITVLNGNSSALCPVTGTVLVDGPADSWANAVILDTIQMGITDVEPGKLIGANYPDAYAASVFGSATPTQLGALPTQKLFQQVFGIFVNTSGSHAALANLTKESVANILQGDPSTFNAYTDWANVPDASTGGKLSSTALPIVRVDREKGSGSRAATNLYFLNYPCGGAVPIKDITSGGYTVQQFATGDALKAANLTAGAIAYAGIDNLLTANSSKYPNLALATINGVAPSNLAAATGAYDFWYESTAITPASVVATTPTGKLRDYLIKAMQTLATAPPSPNINVIPNVGGTATVPLTNNGQTGSNIVYINPYTRGGNSCALPSETN